MGYGSTNSLTYLNVLDAFRISESHQWLRIAPAVVSLAPSFDFLKSGTCPCHSGPQGDDIDSYKENHRGWDNKL